MQFGQVHHIEYYVDDLKKSNEFWDWFMPKMNHKKIGEFDGGVSWGHPIGTYFCFVQVEPEHLDLKNSRQGNGLNHIAFQGGTLEELDLLQKEIEQKGIKILKRDGDYLLFEDPNKFAVEIYAKA